MLPEVPAWSQTYDLKLPSESILEKINTTDFSSLESILPSFLGGNSVANTFPLELTIGIFRESSLRSVKALSCCCSSINSMAKKISLFLEYDLAKQHELRYKKFYEIDPGNTLYFGKSINTGDTTFQCLADEACVYRNDKYVRIKIDDSEILQKGDRILPVMYWNSWHFMYRPACIQTAYGEENKEKAINYISERGWKVIRDRDGLIDLIVNNDPRGVPVVVEEIKNCGIFQIKPQENYCKISICIGTDPENMPPLNQWRSF